MVIKQKRFHLIQIAVRMVIGKFDDDDDDDIYIFIIIIININIIIVIVIVIVIIILIYLFIHVINHLLFICNIYILFLQIKNSIHRFIPTGRVTGTVIVNGTEIKINGTALYSHAVQQSPQFCKRYTLDIYIYKNKVFIYKYIYIFD